MPAPYLRNTVTNDIYPYHELLAAEPNFVGYDGPITVAQPKMREKGTEMLYRPASFAHALTEAGLTTKDVVPPPAKRAGRPPKAKAKEHVKGAELEHDTLAPAGGPTE